MGYNNDGGVDQSRVRGGLLVILNYILVMTGLGLGLATTVLYYVPNNYHGLVMGGMNLKVDIPETQVILRTGSGLDLKVKMAATQVDLANSQHMEAAILTDEGLDLAVSVALPCLMLLLTLPLTLTRYDHYCTMGKLLTTLGCSLTLVMLGHFKGLSRWCKLDQKTF